MPDSKMKQEYTAPENWSAELLSDRRPFRQPIKQPAESGFASWSQQVLVKAGWVSATNATGIKATGLNYRDQAQRFAPNLRENTEKRTKPKPVSICLFRILAKTHSFPAVLKCAN
jgi:hypothetical protein